MENTSPTAATARPAIRIVGNNDDEESVALETADAPASPDEAKDDGKAALYGGALNYEQFRKLFPATRCFQKYDHNGRANLAASHRAGHVQRHSVGEFYYVHELIPDRCYPTARRACEAAFEIYLAQFTEEAAAFILGIGGYISGVVSDPKLAKRWEKANPYHKAQRVVLDDPAVCERIEQAIKSETARLKSLAAACGDSNA